MVGYNDVIERRVNLSMDDEPLSADEIRKKIFNIPYVEWKKRGFSKGTLHYMKKNAEGDQPFTLNKHVMTRLDQWDQSVDKCG